MNAQILRRWSSIKIFMYLLLVFCSLLVFWCQGATTMHLTPLDFSSSNLEQRHHPVESTTPTHKNYLFALIRNTTVKSIHESSLHYQRQKQQRPNEVHEKRHQNLWQMRMGEKRARILTHRKQKLLLRKLLDHPQLSANPNININNLKSLINHHVINQHNENKFKNKKNTSLTQGGSIEGANDRHRREDLLETLNEIMANISVASNRNRRESRFHHHQQQQQMQLNNNNHVNRSNNKNSNRQRRRRYCSARDPQTLAFEAPTVFEGKIKSMTLDRQANYSVTFEIQKVYKQQANFTLPRQVRLQFAYKNASECDIYREEFRHRGFVRDELEQGKSYFLFVKQISLGNFTILGQPIKKISRTAKDVEIGVSEKYGKRASIESMSPNLTVKEGKRVRIVCKVDGEPPPKVTWFKDGRSINRNRTKYIFVHLRRRSDLIIKSAVWNDSGKYECRAKNKLTQKRPVSNFTWLDVLSKYNPTNNIPRTIKPLNEGMKECPAGGQQFCLNGGKCWFIESLQEPSCDCPEGFSGKNCEDKTPNITASFDLADPFVLNPPAAEYDEDEN